MVYDCNAFVSFRIEGCMSFPSETLTEIVELWSFAWLVLSHLNDETIRSRAIKTCRPKPTQPLRSRPIKVCLIELGRKGCRGLDANGNLSSKTHSHLALQGNFLWMTGIMEVSLLWDFLIESQALENPIELI